MLIGHHCLSHIFYVTQKKVSHEGLQWFEGDQINDDRFTRWLYYKQYTFNHFAINIKNTLIILGLRFYQQIAI